MKVYLNKEYKCVKVEDNTFVANDSSNYIRYYFVTNANGDVIDKMDDTSVIYRNTEPSYVTVAFRRADGDVIQHLMASPKTDTTGKSFFEYEITNTDGVLYKKGALEISAQFIEATLSETGGVKKVISQKVKAIAINTAHVLDNIGEEAEEYYSQYEQANNDAHAVLQAQITTNFNNIGTLQELTTDAKDDLVKAINEVDTHADENKSAIGDLSTLTTDEKTTIVGAINEVDEHADANKTEIGNLSALTTDEKTTLVRAINEVDSHANTGISKADAAQATADTATELANTGISKAEQAQSTADNAQQDAETAQATADNATILANDGISKADRAQSTANTAVDNANDAKATAQEAIMKADGRATSIGFMTAKDAVTALNGYPRTQLKGGDTIWIVEDGTPDLWVTDVAQESVPYNYTTKDKFNQDLVDNKVLQIGYFKTAYQESDGKPVTIAWQNVLVKSTDWVASTEFADFPYEAKIELTDFVDYTTVPQVVFDIADTMSGNYAPICKSGDKCVYIYGKVQDEITLKTVITFAPNVNGASVVGGGYNNRGKWVASTTYEIDDLVYTDNGQYVCIEGITSTTSPEQDTQHWQATFVATGKTKNALKFSGQNTDGSAVQKTFDGSTSVEMAFDETTMTAKEVDGVLKVGAKGTIPEALPQTAGALKSGSLPTSGWNADYSADVFKGTYTNDGKYSKNTFYEIPNATAPENKAKLYVTFSNNTTAEMGGIYYSDIPGWQYDSSSTPNGNSVYIRIKTNGQVLGALNGNTITRIATYPISDGTIYNYTISDTSITANSDVLMELTDEGGVKARALASGSITVIRDTVPTQPIPYTYKVKQTNASGQFTLVNHFVSDVPTVPTKTSELENDSGFITSSDIPTIPTKTSELTNDSGFLTTADIPTKTSQLTNDSGFITNSAIGKGTLTIQKNGANVATFGANQSENATANISVPTKTSQLTNDSGFITSADIPSAGAWIIINDEIPKATITEAGTYQVVANSSVIVGSEETIHTYTGEIYFDSLHEATGTGSITYSYASGTSTNPNEPKLSIYSDIPVITSENGEFILRVKNSLYVISNATITAQNQSYAKFKYRKIN